MTAKREAIAFVNDILESIENIEDYIQDVTEAEFEQNKEKQDAVIRRIEIVGEAVKLIPQDIKEQYPAIPWRKLAGMRDIVIHEYFGITLSIIWKTANVDLPNLKRDFEKVKASLNK